MFREGLLVVVSGPSGAGKGTVLNKLKSINSNVRSSVSATTRKPRSGEIDGESYFFMTTDRFMSMMENGELIEWDEYCGNYYGTPKKYVEDTIRSGYDVILEITVAGALNIKKKYPDCVTIFILPPSMQELRNRIVNRGTENASTIEQRLKEACNELKFLNQYDYVVINIDADKAAMDINSILISEKLKYSRNIDILKTIGFAVEGDTNEGK